MSRPLRIDTQDGWYHVTARGWERRELFWDERDAGHFLELLEEMVSRYQIVLHAYVLMGNHYHLFIQTPHVNASRAMQLKELGDAVGTDYPAVSKAIIRMQGRLATDPQLRKLVKQADLTKSNIQS